jgi:branched-chain amino acid transport system ATP-binding protein
VNRAHPLLQVQGVGKHFGGLHALKGVDLSIQQGSIHGLIGPNGAGKTTLFNVITGLYRADEGEFYFEGLRYEPSSVAQVVQRGVARTFQNIRLFKNMSVLDNVKVGLHTQTHSGVWGALTQNKAYREEEARSIELAQSLLDFVGLDGHEPELAHSLSYGDQRRLEIARALATKPKLLALDEPAAGMNASEKIKLKALILKIQASGVTVLLIEHDVKLVMGLCSSLSVLDEGRLICEGHPREVQVNPRVIEAYLGLGSTSHAA